jgi:hypothetical protein
MTHNRPVDQAIAACGGDAREAVKALIVANHYLETDLEKLKAAASMGYARGKALPRVIGRIGMTRMPMNVVGGKTEVGVGQLDFRVRPRADIREVLYLAIAFVINCAPM